MANITFTDELTAQLREFGRQIALVGEAAVIWQMQGHVPPEHRPPHDAREWACPDCGADVLFYPHADGCPRTKPARRQIRLRD